MERATEDLTAKARIRDAALRLFAEQGFEATTVRGIAAAAGVSSGLVRHHFGSKEALRETCDAHALDHTMEIKEEAVLAGRLADSAYMAAVYPSVLLMQRYLARSLVDGSPSAAALFDRMVDLAEQWARDERLPAKPEDPRAFAATLVAMQTGLLMLHDQVSRALGADVLDASGHIRLGRAIVDIYTHPLLTEDQAAQARAAYDQLQARPPFSSALAGDGGGHGGEGPRP